MIDSLLLPHEFMEQVYCPVIVGTPCLTAALWAAWTQAVGSVLAILVAAYVPANIAKRERQRADEETARRAASLAFVLEPALVSMQSLLLHAESQWNQSPVRFVQEGVRLDLPRALGERLTELHVLGVAARPVHEAIVAINRLFAGVNQQEAYWRYGGTYVGDSGEELELEEPNPGIDELMVTAKTATRHAIETLREVHGV